MFKIFSTYTCWISIQNATLEVSGAVRPQTVVFWLTYCLGIQISIALLIPWSRVLLDKVPDCQLVKKFPALYETRIFVTAFTSTRHLSLSWATSIHSTPSYPTCWRCILILSSYVCLGFPCGLFPSSFPTKALYTPLPSPIRATCPSPSHSQFDHPNSIGWRVQIIKFLIM